MSAAWSSTGQIPIVDSQTALCCNDHDHEDWGCSKQMRIPRSVKKFKNMYKRRCYEIHAKSLDPNRRFVQINNRFFRAFCAECHRRKSWSGRLFMECCQECRENYDIWDVCLACFNPEWLHCSACGFEAEYAEYPWFYRMSSCKACAHYFCSGCLLNGECGRCIDKRERDGISNAITESQPVVAEQPHVVQLITEYAVGCVLRCSLADCANTVHFDSMSALYLNTKQGYRSSIYFVKKSNVNRSNRSALDRVYGKYVFVICTEQIAVSQPDELRDDDMQRHRHNQTSYCGSTGCFNAVPSEKMSNQQRDLCLNHPECYFCEQRVDDTRCRQCTSCKRRYCEQCGLATGTQTLCSLCERTAIYKQWRSDINQAIGDVLGSQMVDIIASLSIGARYKLICCNDECKKIIRINSQYEFEQHRDANGQKISHYIVGRHDGKRKDQKHIRFVFGDRRRYFCAHCVSSNAVTKCRYHYGEGLFCKNLEIEVAEGEVCKINAWGNQICMAHIHCDSCGGQTWGEWQPDWYPCCDDESCNAMLCRLCNEHKLRECWRNKIWAEGDEMNAELVDLAANIRYSNRWTNGQRRSKQSKKKWNKKEKRRAAICKARV